MSQTDYMPNDDGGKTDLFIRFRDNITPYLDTLELKTGSAANSEVAQQAADATYFRAVVDFTGTMQQAGQGWTAWKKFVRDGGTGNPPNPVIPALPAGFPVAVLPGIVTRFRSLIQAIKNRKNYTEAIGQTLGIEGASKGSVDLSTLQPLLKLRANGGMIEIAWSWQGHADALDSIEILVNRGPGFVPLTIDTTPGYTDSTPHPATPTKWTYKGIYRVGDNRIGQWSEETSINIGG